jgi:hypothetical protein
MIKNKRIIKFSALKLGLVSLTVSLLSVVLPVGTASVTAKTPDEVNKNVCRLPTYGGRYYCAYGTKSYRLPDGTLQVFVIGTDFSVWTRWQKNGRLSNWVSLGGKIRSTYNRSDFGLDSCAHKPVVVIEGLDHRSWYRIRQANGVWTNWAHYHGLLCQG